MEKDYKISYIRAISTVLVVLIHIAQKISITYSKASLFSDWFNVGLVMFFVISAYLYSQRTIEFPKKWLLKRYMELIIPSIIVVIITVSVFCLFTDVVTTSKVICAFLSGMGFEEFVPDKWVFIQLWYLTYILICYLLIPLIQKIKFKEMNCLLFWGGIIAATIIFQGIPIVIKTFLSIDISISWAQLFRFLFPYVIFRRYDFVSGKLKRIMCVLTVLSLSAILVTCYVRYMINLDGLFASVAELIYIYTLTITGVVLFYWLYLFFGKVDNCKNLCRFTDRYSYPVYLTHCLFIGYSTSVIDRFDNMAFGVLVALLCTAIASFVLEFLSSRIKCRVIAKLMN